LLYDLKRYAIEMTARTIVTHNLATQVITADAAPDVLHVKNHAPLGFAANHNRAFRYLDDQRGPIRDQDWFIVVNPDVRFNADPFTRICSESPSDLGIVAPLVVDRFGVPTDAARELPTLSNVLTGIARMRKHSDHASWFAGMFLAIRASCWRDLGGFSEDYFMYCEDADLCLRARARGWQLKHLKDFCVVHEGQRASHRSLKHFIWHLNSLRKLWKTGAYRSMKPK